jgi:hypothetical protein
MHARSDGRTGVGSESESLFPLMSPAQEGILDFSLLLIFIIPLLYVFFYRPFLLDIKEREKAPGNTIRGLFN